MKNNIKKTHVKFREDLLYFQHFMLTFVFAPNSDYHHSFNRNLSFSQVFLKQIIFFSSHLISCVYDFLFALNEFLQMRD